MKSWLEYMLQAAAQEGYTIDTLWEDMKNNPPDDNITFPRKYIMQAKITYAADQATDFRNALSIHTNSKTLILNNGNSEFIVFTKQ